MERRLYAEVAIEQLTKQGEELCGDKAVAVKTDRAEIVVVSDGLGSGVKANILATLTTKIAASMLGRGIALGDVVETIAETLPICRERRIAYSTLQILKILNDATATVVELDSPPTLLLSKDGVTPFPTEEKVVGGKRLRVGRRALAENETLIAVTDGVIHAGMGRVFPFGWGVKGLTAHLAAEQNRVLPPRELARQVIELCRGYYARDPGDDSTVVVAKLHQARRLSLLIGPPGDRDCDEAWVEGFLRLPGKKAVMGGTTANIVSRVTGRPLTVDLLRRDQNVPPIGHIDGIDLVTEGILTLNAVLERLEDETKLADETRQDGATLLARLLLDGDEIAIFAGRTENAANRSPNNPFQIYKKPQVLQKLQYLLERRGKKVAVEWR